MMFENRQLRVRTDFFTENCQSRVHWFFLWKIFQKARITQDWYFPLTVYVDYSLQASDIMCSSGRAFDGIHVNETLNPRQWQQQFPLEIPLLTWDILVLLQLKEGGIFFNFVMVVIH